MKIQEAIRSSRATADARLQWQNSNAPAPELGPLVEELMKKLESDPLLKQRAAEDLAFNALLIQTLNHLKHVSFDFRVRDTSYPHDMVLEGPFPRVPTLLALKRAAEFFSIIATESVRPVEAQARNVELEGRLLEEQKALVKRITNDSFATYLEMHERLVAQGPQASFEAEFRALVDYLALHLQTDELVIRTARENKVVATFRSIALARLNQARRSHFAYAETQDDIQRTLEFLDIVHRANDPSRSPKLYHSGRYGYYKHFLAGSAPDNILIPTLVSLGATDILKARGVPISLVGVNTDITWVDGYYQTPYEFFVHDINHTRRMWQFFLEDARRKGLSIVEYARRSDEFVKTKIMPLITINKGDDDATKNMKRLRKVLLFEILHEDALPAAPDVIEKAVLRPPNQITPFEMIENGKTVVYVMEPGATTLAYTFRKLAHDFYDMPGERIDYIVAPSFRTRENVVAAANDIFKALGLKADHALFERYVVTDEGFPSDFRGTLERDIEARKAETLPLVNVRDALRLSLQSLRMQVMTTLADVPIDEHTKPEIRSIVQNGRNISVNLTLTQKDGRKFDYQVQIPQEQLSIDKSVGTIDQIKGLKRVIEVESSQWLSMDRLNGDFLANLDPAHFWIVLKASDSKADEILKAAQAKGFETILLGSAERPMRSGAILPTFYAMSRTDQEMLKTWDSLILNDAENTAHHYRLDSSSIGLKALAPLAKYLNFLRAREQEALRTAVQARQIPFVDFSEVPAQVLKGRTPILFSGASLSSWPLISAEQQQNVLLTIQKSLDQMDPSKVVIVTGATDHGVEKIVHAEARKRGFTILGTAVEHAKPESIADVTYLTAAGHSWYGKSRPVLQLIKATGGIVIFIGGGDILKGEIAMARNMDLDYFLMAGPEGAANQMAKSVPSRTFTGPAGLVAELAKKGLTAPAPSQNTASPRPPSYTQQQCFVLFAQ
jgi:hypothetical protein